MDKAVVLDNIMRLCIIDSMKSTAHDIALLRQHMTQTEIARKTGISQSRLSRWESGRIPDSVEDARKLAELAESLRTKAAA